VAKSLDSNKYKQNGQNSNISNNINKLTPNTISKDAFKLADRSVETAKSVTTEIISAENLSDLEKVKMLRMLMEEITGGIEALLPEPSPAPFLYKNRPIRNMSAVQFVTTYFPSYGKTLTLADIRQFDEYLYQCLFKERREDPESWDDFNLPTKDDYLTRRASELSNFEHRQILALASTVLRLEHGKKSV